MSEKRGTANGNPGVKEDRRHKATDVRQGVIILRTPLRRAIFVGGLFGIAALPLVLWLMSG
jgi:hypothetical protein